MFLQTRMHISDDMVKLEKRISVKFIGNLQDMCKMNTCKTCLILERIFLQKYMSQPQ